MIIKRKIKIKNRQGLHARPASMFVKIANKFEAEVTVRKGSESVNGKSIMGLMTLAANEGAIIEIEAAGEDVESVRLPDENRRAVVLQSHVCRVADAAPTSSARQNRCLCRFRARGRGRRR